MWQTAHKVRLPTGVMEVSGIRWCQDALLRNCTEVLDPFQRLKHEDCSHLLRTPLLRPLVSISTVLGFRHRLPRGPLPQPWVACLVPHPFLVMIHVVLLVLWLFPFENLTRILRGSDNARRKFFLQSGRSGSVFGEGCTGVPNCSEVPA